MAALPEFERKLFTCAGFCCRKSRFPFPDLKWK